ncbi:uncharacterized protein DUF11 [Edaphobacter aggregans]|uniref:Uncharacterized protein DUF11 n=1 Tax=Edaphobacter aggregans TaxID=570835 RepID=A0A3R9R4Q7_9BACT|nr:IPT/TIG domain-containing protein [Edaphobacter aggregans]RSL17884.1 uncharacterized protein DUF11 [Edaphobacter aggregans]
MKSCSFSSLPALVCLSVVFVVTGCGNSNPTASNGGVSPTPTPIVLAVVSISPTSVPAGAQPLTLTVTGSGFQSTSVVQVNGASVPTTYVSATQLSAIVPASSLATGAMLQVVVLNGTNSSANGSSVISLEVDNPAPVITSYSPSLFLAGTAPVTISVTGSGFIPGTVLQVNGSARATTYVSATQVSIGLTANDLASPGSLVLTAVNPIPGGGTSAGASLSVSNPIPGLITITPSSVGAGATTSTTVTVAGSNFISSSVAQVNGSARPTTVSSSTQLSFQLTAADQAAAGQLQINVVNPAPGGGTSAGASLSVSNPTPGLITITPSSIAAGATTATTVTVAGSNFISSSVAQVNGSARPTTVSSSTQLSFQLTAADQAAAGQLQINVVNPAPGGGTSAGASLSVSNPTPGLITITPSSIAAGAQTSTTVTVTGSNFISSSVAQVNGSARRTTVTSSTQLSFQLTAADQAAVGPLQINVVNPAPGGGTSTAATFTVTVVGTPIIAKISPAQLIVGSADTNIQIVGTNLTGGATVQWNGTNLPTGYGFSSSNGNYLIATVSANLLAAIGTANISVTNASATPSVSNTITVQIVDPPPPTLTSLSTTLAPVGKAVTITLNGTNFTPASTVALNGVNVPTTFSSYTSQITAAIPATALLTPGVDSVTVTNSTGTSAPLYLTAYVPIINNSMVYNPVNGLFYLSVPSAAGAPYGNSVVSVDPLTGSLGTPITVGSEPDKLAITSDGRYLWVGLDGSSAVRKVDLVAGTAGLQFSLPQEGTGQYAAAALAALPGATDSVVVATPAGNIGQALAIYDNGVARGTPVQATFYTYNPWALVVDGTRNEIYTAGSDTYDTYTYDASGLTLKTANASNQFNASQSYASQNNDEIEIVNGILYTDFGQVDDPESGSVLNNFYSSGTTLAQGSTTIDATQGKAFILENSYNSYQLGAFNLSTFTPTATAPIPVTIPTFRANYQILGPSGMRLTRWGTDGLAFRGPGGFVSLRSSLVQDLSTVNADLGVTITSSAANGTGSTTTYIATVTNNGPASASSVGLTAFLPSTGSLTSATPSSGSCSTAGVILCDLGSLANGASASVVFSVLQTSAGSAAMTVQVTASETDPVGSNNQATSTTNITGGAYNVAPTLSAISPAGIVSGSSDTIITLTGSGFSDSSTVLLNGTSLATNFVSSTQLTATVPAANLATLGWAPIAVSNPAPGGGTSSALPLTVFSVLNLGANHILYDPYSRKIMAGIGAGTPSVAANSIVAVTPDTASIGTTVQIGGTPTNLTLTSDGQILYALLPGATTGSIARFNMLTQQPDFTVSGFATGYQVGLRDIATQPGAENTVAVDEGEYVGISIFDFDPASRIATRRGVATTPSAGTCLAFPEASSMFAVDLWSSPNALDLYNVTTNGLVNGSYPYYVASNIQYLNCYKLSGGLLFTQSGSVAETGVSPVAQVGVFEGMPNVSNYGAGVKDFEPDTSLGLSFYLTDLNPNLYSAIFDSITAFNIQTFMPTTVLSLPFETFEGNTGFTGVDVVRWGQDGLAVLSSGGNVYLVRGGAIVPQLLNVNSAAILTASSLTSTTHGAGNTSLTLTGSNFVPGVAVLWNGSYRTTTIVDPTHVSVAIPASDLAQAGTAVITAVNPGSPASAPLTFSID